MENRCLIQKKLKINLRSIFLIWKKIYKKKKKKVPIAITDKLGGKNPIRTWKEPGKKKTLKRNCQSLSRAQDKL